MYRVWSFIVLRTQQVSGHFRRVWMRGAGRSLQVFSVRLTFHQQECFLQSPTTVLPRRSLFSEVKPALPHSVAIMNSSFPDAAEHISTSLPCALKTV